MSLIRFACDIWLYVSVTCWIMWSHDFLCYMHMNIYQGSQFRTVPYRTGQCTGTDTPLVSYWKKYRLHRPCTGGIRLFRPVNGYRVKIEKSQRKILTNFKNLPKAAALGRSRSQSWSHFASYHYQQPKPTDPNP